MKFQYAARDTMGQTHEGTLEATSEDEAAQQLRREGLEVLELEETASLSLFPQRVSRNEIIYLTNQLAIMVDTGITLTAALAGMLEQEPNVALRKVLVELHQAVESGEDFSSALAKHPRHFDKTYRALVKASEATGTLGPMLERAASYLRKELELRAKVRAAMAYPSVMMTLAIGVTIFLLTYVLPKFVPLFKSKNAELPLPTKIMMGISDALMLHWYWWAAGVVTLLAGFVFARRTATGRRALDWIKIRTPIVGPMLRKVIISRSVRTLGTMLKGGVPIIDAIRLAGEVSSNTFYEDVWRNVVDEVTSGKRVCEVLRGNALFPHVLVQMIAAGEEAGKLDQVLERISIYYDGEVETSVKAATSLIEPLMIAAMGVIVGTIGLALLLPIFSLSRQP